MTAIILTRTNDKQNVHRFYKLDVQPTLFDEWTFVREWGRIGRAGTVRLQAYSSRGLADLALISTWSKKVNKGYR